MNDIEVILILLLLAMGVPDLCRKFGRSALAFPVFVVFGFALNPFLDAGVESLLKQAAQLGFLLLLFEVGLEIDLPPLREFLRPLGFALLFAAAQYPVLFGLANLVGLGLTESFLAAAALTGCSVGMAHAAWKAHPLPDEAVKGFVLQVMVLLELIAIALLSVETAVLDKGFSWFVLLKLLGIAVTVALVARFAAHLTRLTQIILERATRWRLHFLVLLVLAVCALGERLGLSAAKTAFFLGLFMSRVRHGGKSLEEFIAPISHGFLIPLFFVALGLQIPLELSLSRTALLALGSAALLLGLRDTLHRRWLKTGGDRRVVLLFGPNLTIVALAANVLLEKGSPPSVTAWLLLTGLFVTVGSVFLLPRSGGAAAPAAPAAGASGLRL